MAGVLLPSEVGMVGFRSRRLEALFGGPLGELRAAQVLTTPPAPAETAAALDDLTQPGPELLAVACRPADEIGQAFGIPEIGHLSPTGELRQHHWGNDFQPLLITWAKENGITITDDLVRTD